MPRALPSDFVARYARAPAQTTIDTAISLHQNVRDVLGDAEYLTFLQGSYKNDTALADMNDVDIVALWRSAKPNFWGSYDWPALFGAIERKLEADARYRGKWKRHDKCITLSTSANIDIVPAAPEAGLDSDPVLIYSFRESEPRKNWPRLHFQNGARKSEATNGRFKQMVRLFKAWAKCHFDKKKIAPSYYLECLLFSLPNKLFTGDMADSFVHLGRDICTRYGGGLQATYELERIGGKGNLFTNEEWDIERFRLFRTTLAAALSHAEQALAESDMTRAKAAWRRAFAGHDA